MKKSFITYLLILIGFSFSIAQDRSILDSVLLRLETEKIDSARVDLLNTAAWEYRNSAFDSVQILADSALDLAKEINFQRGQVRSYFNLGNLHYLSGEFDTTLDYYLKALDVLEKMKDKKGIANALMGIGNVYGILKENEQAIDYQTQSLKIREEIGDSMGIAASHNNIGSIYTEIGELDKALEHHLQSAAIKEAKGAWKMMSSSYGNIGSIYAQQGKYKEALDYQLKAKEIREKLNNIKGLTMSYSDLGFIYLKLGNTNKALQYQKKALELANQLGYNEGVSKAYLALSNIYEKRLEFMKSLEYYKKYKETEDSLFSVNKATEIAKLESVYQNEKQALEIENLNKEKELKDFEIERHKQENLVIKNRNLFIYSGLIFTIILTIIIFIALLNNKRAKKLISKQKEEVEIQRDLIEEKNTEILDSINYAKRIQAAILPPKSIIKEFFPDSFILYKPKDIVAGDFYWLENIGNKILFAAADCTGHGVPGAMVSVVCNNGLNRSVREYRLTNPSQILDRTKEIVIQEFEKSEEEVRDGMDITLCCLEGNKLTYSGANNPLWIIRGGELIEFIPDRQPIGKFEIGKPFTSHQFEVQKGDTLYLFSDGYQDQFGGKKGKKYKADNFKNFLLAINKEAMEKQKELLEKEFETWRGNIEQIDDICVIGLCIS